MPLLPPLPQDRYIDSKKFCVGKNWIHSPLISSLPQIDRMRDTRVVIEAGTAETKTETETWVAETKTETEAI